MKPSQIALYYFHLATLRRLWSDGWWTIDFLFLYTLIMWKLKTGPQKKKKRKLAWDTVAMNKHWSCFLASWQPGEKGNIALTIIEEEAHCYFWSLSLKFTSYLEAHLWTLIDTIINVFGNSFPTNASPCLPFSWRPLIKVESFTSRTTSVRAWFMWFNNHYNTKQHRTEGR